MSAPIPDTTFRDRLPHSGALRRSAAAGLPDDGIIDRSDPAAMTAWARIMGVHQPQILIAVAVVGPNHDAVRGYLRNSRLCFGPEN